MRSALWIGTAVAVVGLVVAAWPHGDEPAKATSGKVAEVAEAARGSAPVRPRKAAAPARPVVRRLRTNRPPDRGACPEGMTAVPDPVDPRAEPLACIDERGGRRGHWVAWGDLDREAELEAGRALFADAQAHYEAERDEAAAAAFLDAYRMVSSPAFLYNAALCYERAGDWCLAVTYYDAYLKHHPDSEDAAQVLMRATVLSNEYDC